MKKKYMQPTIEVMTTEQILPIAVSLTVNNEAQNGIEGDVKGTGDWNDIWDDQDFEE